MEQKTTVMSLYFAISLILINRVSCLQSVFLTVTATHLSLELKNVVLDTGEHTDSKSVTTVTDNVSSIADIINFYNQKCKSSFKHSLDC